MKKVLSVLGILFLSVFMVLPNVEAETVSHSQKGTYYGDLDGKETFDTPDGLHNFSMSSNKAPEYFYITIKPINLVDFKVIFDGNYEAVLNYTDEDGTIHIMGHRKGNPSGTSFQFFSAVAKKLNADEDCDIPYNPVILNCVSFRGNYFNGGKKITEAEFTAACSGTTPVEPDEPNSETGSVVPYVAVAGGLLAIAAIYFYSKKQSKIYKI